MSSSNEVTDSARAEQPQPQPAHKVQRHGHNFVPDFPCLRCESKGMKCDLTKFQIGGEAAAPMCARCVRTGAKYCIKQRVPASSSGRGDQKRMIYIDPRVGDDYDQDEVFAMIEDLWSGPAKYSFDGTPLRERDINGWALPAWPEADRFAQYEKQEKQGEDSEPAAKEGTVKTPIIVEEQKKRREERLKELTPREKGVEDWVKSTAQSWGKVLPARINKSITQIPGLKRTVRSQVAQHDDLEWEALCADMEAQGIRPPSREEKPELETAESAILRTDLRHYTPRRTHLTQRLEAMRSATKEK